MAMKVQIKRRGYNSRRPFRALNSVTELVGEEVQVTDDALITEAEVEEVMVDSDGEVTLNLSNGDEVILEESEAEELIETGEVESVEGETSAEDFEVTREVVDADGTVSEVTTKVEAESEGDAIKSVELVDSRRGRNSRRYRARSINSSMYPEGVSGPSSSEFDKRDKILSKPESERTEEEKAYLRDKWGYNSKRRNSGCGTGMGRGRRGNTDSEEFKITRIAEVNGRRVRKTASVTAPTVDEAIEAVAEADRVEGIKAEGYEELVEKLPTETVVINSDVVEEEIFEAPNDEEIREPIMSEMASRTDRKSNSFQGVSSFVKRKYGVDL